MVGLHCMCFYHKNGFLQVSGASFIVRLKTKINRQWSRGVWLRNQNHLLFGCYYPGNSILSQP